MAMAPEERDAGDEGRRVAREEREREPDSDQDARAGDLFGRQGHR